MESLNWEEEKGEIKKRALKEHSRRHKLFVEDRLSFERERKQIIDEFINSVEDEERRKKLRELQDSWDHKMKNAGSKHNRFVLAQFLFWKHFNEKWQPAIQQFKTVLNGES